jgi:hypothetical protein
LKQVGCDGNIDYIGVVILAVSSLAPPIAVLFSRLENKNKSLAFRWFIVLVIFALGYAVFMSGLVAARPVCVALEIPVS